MSTAAELHLRRHEAAREIRDIKRFLADSQSFAVRTASEARIAELEKLIPELALQWRTQIVAENEPIVQAGNAELETMRPEIERAYRTIEKPASGASVAEAHLLLGKRDQLIDKVRVAKITILENDPRISIGGCEEGHPGRVTRRGVAA
jgi:hypothetical protein